MADIVENEAKMAYMRPPGGSAAAMDEQRGPSKGFVVREAPWTTGSEKVSIFPQAWHSWKWELVTPSLLNPPYFSPYFLGPWYEQFWRFPQLWSPSGNQDLSLGTQALLSSAATEGPKLNRKQSSPPSSPSWPGLTADPKSLQFWEHHPSLSTYPGLLLQIHQSKSAFRSCNWLVSFVSALNDTVLRLKKTQQKTMWQLLRLSLPSLDWHLSVY